MAAERLPTTGDRVPAREGWGCDTADVVMFHRFLRMVFGDARHVIARVAPDDRRARRRAAQHVRELIHALHTHHHGEDLVLWDTLDTRAPACTVHVAQMRVQHAEIERLLARLASEVDAWGASEQPAGSAAVITALRSLIDSLDSHLAQEEARILPVAAASFTQREWGRLEQHGRRSVPPRWLFVQLGFMLESMPPAERTAFLGALPAPARALWSTVGRRSFARRRRQLLGADFPSTRKTDA